MTSKTIYTDARCSISANDDGIEIGTTDNRHIDLPWSHIIGVADSITDKRTAAEMRTKKIDPRSKFALRTNMQGRELALPIEARSAIESAIADYESRKAEISARKTAEATAARILAANTVTIYLSSRGWGDYSGLEWTGDQRRADAEILAECKHLLATGHDVDESKQTDEQILSKIASARARKADEPRRAKEAEEYYNRDMGAGYCYSCETHCYGDCGHYQPERTGATVARDARLASNETNYGIND